MMLLVASILLILLGIPAGLLVSWLARDELIKGRKWFKLVFILGIVFGAGLLLFGSSPEGIACLALALMGLIAYVKSFDTKWTKKKV